MQNNFEKLYEQGAVTENEMIDIQHNLESPFEELDILIQDLKNQESEK